MLFHIIFQIIMKYLSYMTPWKLKLRWFQGLIICFRVGVWTQAVSDSSQCSESLPCRKWLSGLCNLKSLGCYRHGTHKRSQYTKDKSNTTDWRPTWSFTSEFRIESDFLFWVQTVSFFLPTDSFYPSSYSVNLHIYISIVAFLISSKVLSVFFLHLFMFNLWR